MKLTLEEETRLALAAQRGDMKAKDRLFRCHARMVRWISFRFSGPDRDDLFAAGSLGWVHALRTWKPKKGAGLKAWVTLWVRAYAGRATTVQTRRRRHELSFDLPGNNDETLEADISDEGLGAEEMIDELWRAQTHGIIDGMVDRRLAVVLQDRMRGHSLEEVASRNRRALRLPGGAGRETVRKLTIRGVAKARALVRA